MAVLHGMCHESVLCVDVECVKNMLFCNCFNNGGHFSSKGAKSNIKYFSFGAPSLHSTTPKQNFTFMQTILETQGKREPNTQRAQS